MKNARKIWYDKVGDFMKSVGLICEYNPFHNGHLYHLQKVKEMFKESTIILVVSGNVTQRGDISILTKWEKAEIALHYGVDLVVELPYLYASQSADIFCKGAMKLLSYLKVDAIVFGSEIGSIEPFIKCANATIYSSEYQERLQYYFNQKENYPTSLSKALFDTTGISIHQPNDLLGLGYVKEILKNHYPITPITIPRTNEYHSTSFSGNISSASSIRMHLKNKENIENQVPAFVLPYLKEYHSLEDFFPYIRYKILSDANLNQYETVDERIINRLQKKIESSQTLEEFINQTKTKYYTYNRLMRMCSHILFSFTKEENQRLQDVYYLRILGFSEKGRKYLNAIKKDISIPIITNYSNNKNHELDLDLRITKILSLIKGNSLLEDELTKGPIKKDFRNI